MFWKVSPSNQLLQAEFRPDPELLVPVFDILCPYLPA